MTRIDDFDLQGFLPYLLNQAADVSSNGFQNYYKAKYGMLRTEWRIVFHLGSYGTLTAKEICARARIHKTKVSRAVTALEKKRFLTRSERPTDRRHEELALTSRGRAAFTDLHKEAKRYDHQIMSHITEEHREILRDCLRQIAEIDTGS